MNFSLIIVSQLLQMFIVVLFGFILFRLKVLNLEGTQQIANMLTKFIVPLTLILAFQNPFDPELLNGLVYAFLGSVIIFFVRIIWAQTVLKKANKIDRYTTVFSNSVYMGIPILFPIVGYEGIMYLSMYIILSGSLQFTYGIWNLSDGSQRITLKKGIVNPGIIGTLVGFTLYILNLQLPPVLFEGLDSIASLSSPLGMILLGSYLARSHLKQVFFIPRNYWVVANRLLFTPFLCVLALWLLPTHNAVVLFMLSVVNCAPTAVNSAVFSQIYGGDFEYGARLVALSSILSMVTMPILLTFSSYILGFTI